MIPAYNPPAEYLREALLGVLEQAPAADRMQIEVVDDHSPKVDVAALVHEIAGDRVMVSKTPTNLGLAGCWNACIARARGEWVHIFHQDDLVLPGFYRRFEALFAANPGIAAAFSRHFLSDSDGHIIAISELETREAGIPKEFSRKLAEWQRMQCAAVVVKRSTYEGLGGYRHDLPYVLDWEMWCRIAASGAWGYVPQPGAAYRTHQGSETGRLAKLGKTLEDFLHGGGVARGHFDEALRQSTEKAFFAQFTNHVFESATARFVAAEPDAAASLLREYRREAFAAGRAADWARLRARIGLKQLTTRFK